MKAFRSEVNRSIDAEDVMTDIERLWQYIRPNRAKIGVCVLLSLAGSALTAIAPIVMQRAVDDLIRQTTKPVLVRYAAVIVGIALIQGAVLFIRERLFQRASYQIEHDLRKDFYRGLQRQPMEFFQTHKIGDLIARATNDLTAVIASIGPVFRSTVSALFVLAVIVPLMISLSGWLTLFSFASTPLLALNSQLYAKRLRESFDKVQEFFGRVSSRARESFAAVRTIRAYTQEPAEIESFRSLNREYVGHSLKLIHLLAVLHPLFEFLTGLSFMCVLWYGGDLVIEKRLSIGQFVEFSLLWGILVATISDVGWAVGALQRVKASMRRINSIMSIEPAITDAGEPVNVREIRGEIEFRDLTFRYEKSSNPALSGITLRIRRGQTVAFVGPVGSGKSTLLNLVPRLLDAEPYELLLDGVPINEIPIRVLRSSIGYVGQETILLSGSVAGNIAFGTKRASLQAIERAASQAAIAEDIADFPAGYETSIGERGSSLSGGQKQRLAIARALIREPRILILDNALSAVDGFTEEAILKSLREVMRNKTCLIASHRLRTVKEADVIVVLDEGRIVEQGTHGELLESGGAYADMYERQLLEEELTADW